jgi:hypothetical protein
MVPAGSQGAPFRGQQGAAGQEERESPAPKGQQQMAPVELVDEEAAGYLQLQKEYKDLRKSPTINSLCAEMCANLDGRG